MMTDKEYKELLEECRPMCSCGEKMIVVLYVGLKEKIKFFHCDNCELDPAMYDANDTWLATGESESDDLDKLLEREGDE